MAWLGLVASLAGTAIQASSQVQQGRIEDANARIQASQDDRDANIALAEAQATAAQERRRARLLRSRALAVAGASGAGISEDPTVANILGDLDKEGELRALNALYEGDYLAEGLRSGAETKRRMGKAYRSAGTLNSFGTLAEGGANSASFHSRYG